MLTLEQRASLVRRTFYRLFDGRPHDAERNQWWWIEYVYGDHCIAYAAHAERWYRVGYTLDESGADPVVTFAEETMWEQVTMTWTPVADGNGVRSMASLRIRKLPDVMPEDLPAIITRDGHTGYQTRSMSGQVRYIESERRTVVTLNTSDIDSHRTIIDPAGGDWTTHFRGKFFLGHDMMRVAGLSPAPELRDGNWVVSLSDDDWDLEDPDIANWHRKVKRGFVDEVSIGFEPVDGQWETHEINGTEQRVFRFTKWYGREFSWVGMGSNPGAVVTERTAQTSTQTAHRIAPACTPRRSCPIPPQTSRASSPTASPVRTGSPARAASETPPDRRLETRRSRKLGHA